ncbi:OPT oligopeptide transporter protein-domain-containing protein [Blyttiomyces helicus]|uniref:OPT oligopeptide transporter protein-domain-containing protein n=1 Tax=Blyttiomyces helicus TaxID=388810 RepID=A0A4P9WHY8_9FUNG|nr:OPT oligopeptide transporter protein-domain-containing protein [Blyttiomyces helicus]|eukprot:RKO91473.1 OPT oligopeptide transporter protein-domain-containing protein [Blyttiomyces helicus]
MPSLCSSFHIDFSALQLEFPGDHSTIPEVAATIPTPDDSTLPVLTFRFWLIGTIFTIFSAALAQFMVFRWIWICLNGFSAILMTYPLGKFCGWVTLPDWRIGFHWPLDLIFRRGTFIGGSLNPGPYNIKEHTLIFIAANINNTSAYATNVLIIQRLFYGADQNPNNVGWTGALLLIWTTQCIGYGFAGLCRRWLVYPAAMWWPSTLVFGNMLHVFHAQVKEGIVVDRMKLFNKLTACAIVYEFLPQYFAPYLGKLSIFCLIFGGLKGKLGNPLHYPLENPANAANGGSFGMITLDWQQVSGRGPMYIPFWAQMNAMIALIVSTWIVAPWMYRKNVWAANRYPLTAVNTYYDVHGDPYNTSQILNPETQDFEYAQYVAYSPARLSTYWALMHGTNFAVITSLLVHVGLFHAKELIEGLRATRNEVDDVHMKVMRKYSEVPTTWYIATLVIFGSLALFTVEHYAEFQIRWWGVLLAQLIVVVFVIPVGIIRAISSVGIHTNVIADFFFSLAVYGKAVAIGCFESYGCNSMDQALSLVGNLKLGVYMKIPPKAIFICQMYATLLGAVVNYAVLNVIIINVPDNHQAGLKMPINPIWASTIPKTFYTNSLFRGDVGYKRIFGADSPYHPLLWFFLIGAFLPIPGYLLHRLSPNFGWNYVNWPIFLFSWGTGTPISYLMAIFVSYFSQFYAKRYRRHWYDKYNYTISAALDSGLIVTTILVYLVVTLPGLAGAQAGQYVYWAFNPNATKYADQDYCLNYSAV